MKRSVGGKYVVMYIPPELKQELIAMAYMLGHAGMYSKVIRKLLQIGVERYKAGLDAKKTKDFELILNNVRIADMVSPPTGERKSSKYIKVKERGG